MNDANQYTVDLEKTDGPMAGDFIVWGDLDLLKNPEDPKTRIIVCTCSHCWRFVGLTFYDIHGEVDEVRCSRCGATSKCKGIEYRSMREAWQRRIEMRAQQQASSDGELAEVV